MGCLRACCQRRRCCVCRRPLQHHRQAGPRGPKHPDSDSECEEAGTCKADCIAWTCKGGKIVLLSKGECKQAASRELTRVLVEDGVTSDTAEMSTEAGVAMVPMCRHHQMQYAASRLSMKCARDQCYHLRLRSVDGIPLCDQHARVRDEPHRTAASIKPPGVRETRPEDGNSQSQPQYNVWLPVLSAAGTSPRYYRFNGLHQGTEGKGSQKRTLIDVRSLGNPYSVLTSSLVPWSDAHGKSTEL